MKSTPLKLLLVVLVLLALAVPLVWTKVIAPFPTEWAAVHTGMEQKEIHRILGSPASGNFEEEQREQWEKNSALVFRRMDAWYQDSAHPTRATEVVVASHWHFGMGTTEHVERSADK